MKDNVDLIGRAIGYRAGAHTWEHVSSRCTGKCVPNVSIGRETSREFGHKLSP